MSPIRPGLRCIQGIMNLLPCGPEDGGLFVYKGSHRAHQKFFEKNKLVESAKNNNWFKFSGGGGGSKDYSKYLEEIAKDGSKYIDREKELKWGGPAKNEKEGDAIPMVPHKVCAAAGDLILFDSRTHHQAKWPGPPASSDATPKIRRAAIYTCMSRRCWATPEAMRVRRQALALIQTTSHWPHEPKIFQDSARFSNGACKHVAKLPELTELGKKIAGLDDGERFPPRAVDKRGNPLKLTEAQSRRDAKMKRDKKAKEKKNEGKKAKTKTSTKRKRDEEDEDEEAEAEDEKRESKVRVTRQRKEKEDVKEKEKKEEDDEEEDDDEDDDEDYAD